MWLWCQIFKCYLLPTRSLGPTLGNLVKFMFSKKATKINKIFTVDLTVTTYCQIDGEDFVNFCGLLRKREHYEKQNIEICLIYCKNSE